ncbi:MAG TPA: hypothetical protein PKH02_07005 [Bacteroidales bacterium]|nr:hypothetical protein [Bacteroidales bacterium]HPT13078.1 hypothetical protein [Bacteroidales bacterium]
MKYLLLAFSFAVLFFTFSCSKSGTPTSGTVTLDNKLYGSAPYYSMGFTFSGAKKVSTLANPAPDLTIEAGVLEGGVTVVPFLEANTLEPAFGLIGQYGSSEEAETAFNALVSVGSPAWIDLGAPLAANQLWVFRTGNDTYAKLLILSVSLNTGADPDFASCTFKWVYQPDGTATFPAL